MPPPSNDDDTEWPSFMGPQYPAVLDGDDAPPFWCDFFWLLDVDSFARVVNLASSARSRQTRTSPVVGESSRVSIREHAIMFWVGRSACVVVIVGTCLPLLRSCLWSPLCHHQFLLKLLLFLFRASSLFFINVIVDSPSITGRYLHVTVAWIHVDLP